MLFILVKDKAKHEALKAIEIKSIYFALRSASTYIQRGIVLVPRSFSEKFKQNYVVRYTVAEILTVLFVGSEF